MRLWGIDPYMLARSSQTTALVPVGLLYHVQWCVAGTQRTQGSLPSESRYLLYIAILHHIGCHWPCIDRGKSCLLYSGERWSEIRWSQHETAICHLAGWWNATLALDFPLEWKSGHFLCTVWGRLLGPGADAAVAFYTTSFHNGSLVSSSFKGNAILLIFGWLSICMSLWVPQWAAMRNSSTLSLEVVSVPELASPSKVLVNL